MAAPLGYSGGRSRCFTYWQEFAKCYSQTDNPQECRPQADDYTECLHHKNEIARSKAIKAVFTRKAEHQAKEGRKVADTLADGITVGVGLITRDKGGDEVSPLA